MRLRHHWKQPDLPRSCHLTPSGPDEQWGIDFVSDSLMSGRRVRILTVPDLWDRPGFGGGYISLSGQRVVEVLERLIRRGRLPCCLRTDNGLSSQVEP